MTDKQKEFDFEYQKAEIQGALNLLMTLKEKEKALEIAILADDRNSTLEKINNNIKIQWLLELKLVQENCKNTEGQIRNFNPPFRFVGLCPDLFTSGLSFVVT